MILRIIIKARNKQNKLLNVCGETVREALTPNGDAITTPAVSDKAIGKTIYP